MLAGAALVDRKKRLARLPSRRQVGIVSEHTDADGVAIFLEKAGLLTKVLALPRGERRSSKRSGHDTFPACSRRKR